MQKPLTILVIDEDASRREAVTQSLVQTGAKVLAFECITLDMIKNLPKLAPDVVIIDTDSPDRDMLEHVCAITRDQPRPIVMFTHDEDAAKMRKAIQAGVTSYVVNSVDPARLRPIMQVAMMRFEEFQGLRRDLADAKTQLAERKLIDRAKGLIMKQKSVDEDEAYRLLRSMAMNRKAKIADIAAQIIDVSDLLA